MTPNDFSPINSDNSISACTMAIAFLPSLSVHTLEAIRDYAYKWGDQLPGLKVVDAIKERSNSIVVLAPPTNNSHGLKYTYFRPDGSAVWSLTCANNEIRLTCTRYTRWKHVWKFASEVISELMDEIRKIESDLQIAMLALKYEDKFSGSKTAECSSILRQNNLVPKSMSDWGRVWHTESGWFDENDDLSILHNVALNATENSNGDGSFDLSINHTSQARFKDAKNSDLKLLDWKENIKDTIYTTMDILHLSNKKILKEILTKDAARSISLEELN